MFENNKVHATSVAPFFAPLLQQEGTGLAWLLNYNSNVGDMSQPPTLETKIANSWTKACSIRI
jgi:hypothetical protein